MKPRTPALLLSASALALSLALASPARATTFGIDYENRESIDPLEGFDVDCGGTTETEDCPERAAALHAELVENLNELAWDDDPATAALFQDLLAASDPQLKELALRYFARQTPPPSLWSQARTFFFGPDAVIAQPSARILSQSSEEIDRTLAQAYFVTRPTEERGEDLPRGSGETDSWAKAFADDATLDEVYPFTESERFPDAARLLMIDRFSRDPFGADPLAATVAVTGFVSDASVDEVSAHFTSVFGRKPYPSVQATRDAQQALTDELLSLQQRLASGDAAAGERFKELTAELESLQAAQILAARLDLEGLGCSEHAFWTQATLANATKGPLQRAVVVGTDATVGRTVIRYISGVASADVPASGGSGGVTGSGGRSNSRGGTGAAGAAAGTAGAPGSESSGCGCAVPRSGSRPTLLWAFAALALAMKRRRSHSRRSRGW